MIFDRLEKPWTREPSRRSESVGGVVVEARRVCSDLTNKRLSRFPDE